mmetsp:Transcript_20901/g.53018  ORF Transcript_20901/g.53018 Transcript_20901/m.53018 type:complete len:246 (+) Transcript_20901:173-910(+)
MIYRRSQIVCLSVQLPSHARLAAASHNPLVDEQVRVARGRDAGVLVRGADERVVEAEPLAAGQRLGQRAGRRLGREGCAAAAASRLDERLGGVVPTSERGAVVPHHGTERVGAGRAVRLRLGVGGRRREERGEVDGRLDGDGRVALAPAVRVGEGGAAEALQVQQQRGGRTVDGGEDGGALAAAAGAGALQRVPLEEAVQQRVHRRRPRAPQRRRVRRAVGEVDHRRRLRAAGVCGGGRVAQPVW